jgi:peroxiredoxin
MALFLRSTFLLVLTAILPLGLGAQGAFDPGLQVGDEIPDFRLRDQNGDLYEFESLMGTRGLAILFFRSADWCPYCKTALAQLEEERSGYQEQGLRVVGISYDPVEVLAAFADRVGIEYRMLSDEGSATIRDFGLLNTDLDPGNPRYGIPHPGMVIVDAQRKIVAKYFEEDFRERFTPATILTREFGPAGGRETRIETPHLALTARLSQDVARPGNRVTMVVDIELPERMHIYAPEVEGYIPVEFNMDAHPEVTLHPVEFPEAEILYLEAIDERVPVYHDAVRITQDFTVSQEPASETVELTGELAYQACDDEICFLPTDVPVSFRFQIGSLDRTPAGAN